MPLLLNAHPNSYARVSAIAPTIMMRTCALVVYTVACALLLVTWMTEPASFLMWPVTATRRLPSGAQATPYTYAMVRAIADIHART